MFGMSCIIVTNKSMSKKKKKILYNKNKRS